MIVLIDNSLPRRHPKSLLQKLSNMFLSVNAMWIIPRRPYLLHSLPCIFLFPLKILRRISPPNSNLPSGGLCSYWEQQELYGGLRNLGKDSEQGDDVIYTYFPQKMNPAMLLGWLEGVKPVGCVVVMKMGKKLCSELQKLPSPRSTCSELSLAAFRNNLPT